MRAGADVAETREKLELMVDNARETLHDWHPDLDPRRVPRNLAWKLFEKIEQAGAESNEDISPFEAYARRHRRLLAGVVSKCARAVLHDDVAGHVVAFYCPRGGW